ncbi:MAG TPA: DUF3592 domain-containing protein [Ktedonobacteraceae bacterium]
MFISRKVITSSYKKVSEVSSTPGIDSWLESALARHIVIIKIVVMYIAVCYNLLVKTIDMSKRDRYGGIAPLETSFGFAPTGAGTGQPGMLEIPTGVLTKRSNHMVGLVIGVLSIGVLFLLFIIVLGGIEDRHRKWLDQHGEIVSATVTRIKRKWGDEGGMYYVVRAQWTDPRPGSTYAFSKRKNRRPQYSEGSHIQVGVNQSKPSDYAIKD